MDYKEELIKRVKFLLENDIYLIEPQDKRNLLFLYKKLEQNDNEVLQNLEYLLLGDDDITNNPIYQDVLLRKNDKEYLLKLKENKDMVIEYFTILSLIRKFIVRQKTNDRIISTKLKAIDEYFKIVRYQNNGKVYTSGAILEPSDIANGIKIESGIIGNGIFKEDRINGSIMYHSKFMDYLIDEKNYHKDNLSILTEKEKQDIYLSFHDEIPWNTKTVCQESDLFFSDSYCNNEFSLDEDEMFYYNGNFYMMCPLCYNVTIIDKEKISKNIQQRIINKTKEIDNYLRIIFYKREYLLHKKNKMLTKKM